jgi:hypothetical protein
MDFITDLPLSEGCDQLWVIIDRFTKMAHFIPLKKKIKKGEDLAEVDMEIARHTNRYHFRPRLQIHINILEVLPNHPRYKATDVDRVPSTN